MCLRFLTLVFFAAIFQLPLAAVCETPESVHIGVLLPLSGEVASWGQAVQNGLILGLDSAPEDIKRKIIFHFEDDAMLSRNTVSAYRKLSSSFPMTAFVTLSSGTSKTVAPITEQLNIPLLAIATDPSIPRNRKWVVNFWPPASAEAKAVVQEIISRKYQQIARISSLQDFMLAMKLEIDKLNNQNFDVVLDEEYPIDIKDFKPFIVKLRARKVDALCVGLLPGQLGIFAKQLRQAGVNIPIFGYETFEDANEVKISEGALVGHWYVNAADPTPFFKNKYKEKFNAEAPFPSSIAYDISLVISKAVESGITTKDRLMNYLHTIKDFHGAQGTFSAYENSFTFPMAVKVVTKDGFKTL